MDHAAADGCDDAPLVLIVDDERDIADMLDSYFRLEGYRTIVALLAKRPGQVFGRDMIYERVWGKPGDSSVVTEHVRRIRRALAEAGCETEPVATVWGGHLGLGLYVSRLLAEKHGGELEVANGPGGGALARATLAAPVIQICPEPN